MSKINEYSQLSDEVQQAYMFKFMDFVYDNIVSTELNEDDVIEMESSLNQRPLPLSKSIISNISLNNINYQPRQGA